MTAASRVRLLFVILALLTLIVPGEAAEQKAPTPAAASLATAAIPRSQLATAVYDAGCAAGMSFPFPQREVRLLRDAPAAENPREPPRGQDS